MNEAEMTNKSILFFDGNCGLCNRSVKFVLRKEKNQELIFSPLQSEFAKKTLAPFNLGDNLDSMILFKNGKVYLKSSGALRVTNYLKGLWPSAMLLLIVPSFLRNFIYDYIAKNRITWFGTANYCEMMTPELKKRFLE